MTLGDIVADYREKKKMSLGDFAKKSGLSKSYLVCLERNEHPTSKKKIRPTLDTAIACCQAMDMDILALLRKIDPKMAQSVMPAAVVPSRKADPIQNEETSEFAACVPATVPDGIAVTTDSLVEGFKQKRVLILPYRIPRQGDMVYIPIKKYMAPVAFTVEKAGGGAFCAYAESCGSHIFTIFDLNESVFFSYGEARRIVERWEWEKNPVLRR